MADANGIIFKNPTLNTWFVGPSVDLTAWNVITVSDCTEPAFNLDYTYVPATAKWVNGIRSVWKDTLWYMSDGAVTYTAPDNGLTTPPTTFTRTLDYPLTITAVGAGTAVVNGECIYRGFTDAHEYYYNSVGDVYLLRRIDDRTWYITETYLQPSGARYTRISIFTPQPIPSKDGWLVSTGDSPAPTLEYTLEATATVSPTSSTATWVSNNPTTGFISLTTTLTAVFGYVITFDVQGGTAYPYYKYCTKTAGEVYGTMPTITRENFIFAGWYTGVEGTGTRIAATDTLAVAADDTLYAKWVKYVSGKVGCAASLVSLFTLGIGTDFFCEHIGSRLANAVKRTIVRKLPKR